jgi:hypothetical protein
VHLIGRVHGGDRATPGEKLPLMAMFLPPLSPAVDIAAHALLMRRQELRLPALEVLDQVMRGRGGRPIDFANLALPPSPFALLVAEAYDRGMLPCDWAGLLRPSAPARVHELLRQIWADEVWPKFVVRYSLYRPTSSVTL